MPIASAAPHQSWATRQPRLSPDADRTGRAVQASSVLVVDDDPGVRLLTARMLRLEGYNVLEAGSGSEALRVLDTASDIGLVVTDIVMPGMHGLDLARRVLARTRSPHVVLMTGHAAELSTQLEHQEPRLPLLLKPFTAEQLLRTVRRVLHHERH